MSVIPLSAPSTPSMVKHSETSNISMHASTSVIDSDDSLSDLSALTTPDMPVDLERAVNTKDSGSIFDDLDDDELTSDTESIPLTSLSLCISKELADPSVASVTLFKGLLASFPRKISATSDALYWADKDDNGKAAVVKFFGLLDTRGAHGRTKPYFSLDGMRGELDPRNFKKTKALFEVRPLPISSDNFPLEARRQSNMFVSGLMMLTDHFEAKRNQNLQKDQIPNVSKMLKENREEDTYTLVIQTEPLFAEPDVDSGNTHEATLTIDDLESDADFSVLSSPSKVLARKKANMKKQLPVEPVHTETASAAPTIKTLFDMPDPNGLYSKFLARHPNFSNYEVIPPPIYDGNNDIIHPAEYNTRLPYLAPVSVEANIRLWEIAPESGTRKGGRANGSRTYQLMMKKLQLLPYIPKEIQKPPQLFKGKGKRRAATTPNDDQGSSLPSTPTKKPRRQQANIVDNVRNDPDFRMSD